jgi:hypothetical protein
MRSVVVLRDQLLVTSRLECPPLVFGLSLTG